MAEKMCIRDRFAHSLMRMYTMYVQSRGWELEVLNLNETELGGVKEAILAVNGAGAYNRLKYESGVHRVQRVPETETQGRIHTSTATVAVMPQAEEVDLVIDPKDLRIDTFRSSGAGGQHINKTSSAIPVSYTHLDVYKRQGARWHRPIGLPSPSWFPSRSFLICAPSCPC